MFAIVIFQPVFKCGANSPNERQAAEGGQFDLEAYKAKLLAELKSRQGDEGGGGGGGSDRIDNEERHQYYDDIQVRSLSTTSIHYHLLSCPFWV